MSQPSFQQSISQKNSTNFYPVSEEPKETADIYTQPDNVFDLTKRQEVLTPPNEATETKTLNLENDDDPTVPTISGKAKQYSVRITPSINYRPIQKWEGTVTEIEGNTFIARLRDLTLEDRDIREIGSFDFSEAHKNDQSLIKVGAVFYYTISFATDNKSGQPFTESRVYFVRKPPYSKRQIEQINARAEALHALIQRSQDQDSSEH